MKRPAVNPLKVEVVPTKQVRILGCDKRAVEDLAWCAVSMDLSKLFWLDGHFLCLETYEKAFEQELETGIFSISQVCYAEVPNYVRLYDVGRGIQIPVVNVSGMRLFEAIAKAIRENGT
ncbi:MAG: hypothetical protein QW057_09610 [Candidatus Bathyarchaeia archaeon]